MKNYNGYIAQATDDIADELFGGTRGHPIPNKYSVFFDNPYDSASFESFTMFQDGLVLDGVEKFSNPSACNGAGIKGSIHRFTTKDFNQFVEIEAKVLELTGAAGE